MHLKTIAFGAGMLTAVGLIVMCKPASKLMKDVKTSVEDYMEKMKKKSCTCNSKGNAIEEESFKSDKEVFKLAQDIFDDIQSIDVEELSSEYKKVFSKIKKSILSILELGN
ncbi:MAG: hypothetical protein ACI31I_03540 [Bacilli bacterium]|nr:hypothetical protein [Bacilli bacterium]